MDVRIEKSWKSALASEFESPYFQRLAQAVRNEYASVIPIYPPASKIFAAFDASPLPHTKVVILGQDPYHGPGQANGLAFSVAPGVTLPPSLRNIFQEVSDDTGAPSPKDGDLSRWANQGVLLLNSSLTVREHSPKSHAFIGWSQFTDAAIKILSEKSENIVFLLWGSDAISKRGLIDPVKHLILIAPHPSPLSAYRGFFGCKHFSKANEYLMAHGRTPINW